MSAGKSSTVQQELNSAEGHVDSGLTGKRKKVPNGHWLIESNVRKEAAKYKTKSEMKKKRGPAYVGMCKLGLTDELFPNGKKSNSYWTMDRCIAAAKNYNSLTDFSLSREAKAYQKLSAAGLIRKHTKHMNHQKMEAGYWSFDNCKKEALKYKTINELRIFSPACYDKARDFDWILDITKHMESGYKSSDCVYVWRVKGSNIYKIGVSKKTICRNRINIVSKAHNVDAVDINVFEFNNPNRVEKIALSFGQNADMNKHDGYTEFRVMSNKEYSDLIYTLESYSE